MCLVAVFVVRPDHTGILKCHLWFWLADPVTSAVLRETLRQRAPRIDSGTCTPSQPHYTADPILIGVLIRSPIVGPVSSPASHRSRIC